VERYEQLRARVLAGEPGCFTLGLQLLEHRGVAAWARAFRATTPARAAPPRPAAQVPAEARQLVDALATIALACAAAG
jgi:hypothetical protein